MYAPVLPLPCLYSNQQCRERYKDRIGENQRARPEKWWESAEACPSCLSPLAHAMHNVLRSRHDYALWRDAEGRKPRPAESACCSRSFSSQREPQTTLIRPFLTTTTTKSCSRGNESSRAPESQSSTDNDTKGEKRQK